MTNEETCSVLDPVWDRRCQLKPDHEPSDLHRNEEPGDTLTWGSKTAVRAYERGEIAL